MTISTFKKPLIIIVLTAFILLSFGLHYSFNASAATVSVGASLFTDIDNVSIVGTREGLELTSQGKRDTSAKYARKLYFGKDFSFNFAVTEQDFDSVTFSVLTEHGDKTVAGNISDDNRRYTITLTKKETSFDASIKVPFIEEEVTVNIPASFKSNIKIGYNTANKKFYIEAAGSTYVLDREVNLYRNEGEVTIGFKGVEIGKSAVMLIKSINGQKFLSTTAGNVVDDVKPVLRLNTDFLTYNNTYDAYIFDAPLYKVFELPIYGLDVISSTIRYELKTLYSEDGTFDEAEDIDENKKTYTVNSIPLQKEGFYKITQIKINDNNGNHQEECEDFDILNNDLIIRVQKWNDAPGNDYAPELLNFNNYLNFFNQTTFFKGGNTHKFRFAQPEVLVKSTPAGVTENPNYIMFKLRFKQQNTSTWSEQDGLIFTANRTGAFDFQIRAIDRMGNMSSWSQTITLNFDDYTPPRILVTGFPTEKFLNQSLTLPSGSVTDDMDSSPTRSIKVYYIMDLEGNNVFEKDEDGNVVLDDENNPKKVLVSESATFIPEKLGWYEVLYTAEDASGNITELAPMTFVVKEAVQPTPQEPFIDLTNIWNIIFLSIAGLSAMGLIILMFIKPKEQE